MTHKNRKLLSAAGYRYDPNDDTLVHDVPKHHVRMRLLNASAYFANVRPTDPVGTIRNTFAAFMEQTLANMSDQQRRQIAGYITTPNKWIEMDLDLLEYTIQTAIK